LAKAKLMPLIKSIHGRIGNIIFYNVKGYQYARSYTIPRNPRSRSQQKNRTGFGTAVKLWQDLPLKEKSFYNRLAKNRPLSGYNLFISMQMKGITHESIIEFNTRQRYNNILPAGYQRANTSVSAYMQPDVDAKSPDIYNSMPSKPPGWVAEAS